jgi:hypothetical protein
MRAHEEFQYEQNTRGASIFNMHEDLAKVPLGAAKGAGLSQERAHFLRTDQYQAGSRACLYHVKV